MMVVSPKVTLRLWGRGSGRGGTDIHVQSVQGRTVGIDEALGANVRAHDHVSE